MKQYYIELYQPKSHDELKSFHTNIIQAIHDQSQESQPKNSHFSSGSAPHYESIIGISYPTFGVISHYLDPTEEEIDLNYKIDFAENHSGLYIGSVVHCISSNDESLSKLSKSKIFDKLRFVGCQISDIYEVSSSTQKAIFKRDRRADRRTKKYRLKSTISHSRVSKKINLPPSIREPLPWIKRAPYSIYVKKETPHENKYVVPEHCFYSIFGFSKNGSSVPILPILNTNFSMALPLKT